MGDHYRGSAEDHYRKRRRSPFGSDRYSDNPPGPPIDGRDRGFSAYSYQELDDRSYYQEAAIDHNSGWQRSQGPMDPYGGDDGRSRYARCLGLDLGDRPS